MGRIKEKLIKEKNVQKAYKYFTEKGLPEHLTAGIIGNLMQESYIHLDSSVENEIGAVGIAQWLGARRKNLESFAKKKGKDFKDFDLQLDFLWHELNTTGDSWNRTKDKEAFFSAKSAEEAARIFVDKFERSGEKPGDHGFEKRLTYANSVYNTFAKTVENKEPRREEEKGLATKVADNTSVDLPPAIYDIESEDKSQKLLEKISNWQDQKDKADIAQANLQKKQKQKEFLKDLISKSGVQFINRTDRREGVPQQAKEPEYLEHGGEHKKPKEKVTYHDTLPEVVVTHDRSEYEERKDRELQELISSIDSKLSKAREISPKKEAPEVAPKRDLRELKDTKTDFEKLDISTLKTKEDIMRVQKMLVEKGYDLGKYGKNKDGVDGLIGSKTRGAVAKFNKRSPEEFIKEVAEEQERINDIEKRAATGELSLEEEEELRRKETPKREPLKEALHYFQDNVGEHVFQPILDMGSELLPGTLKTDPSLKTVGKYNNTEGALPILIDDMPIEEIRKQKNISFAQISREGRKSNQILPLKLKERVLNATYPQGYGVDINMEKEGLEKFEALTRFMSEESKDGQIKRLPGKKGDRREDIFRMYAGLPQKHDSFTVSSFKAGSNSDSNVTYKDPETVADYALIAAASTDLIKKLKNGEITPETIKQENSSGKKGGEKIHKATFRDPKNVMWNATFGVGFDGKGQPYLSFYDNWDLAGKDDWYGSESFFGAPIEIYDRIPLTEEFIDALSKVSHREHNDGASDGVSEDAIEDLLKELKAQGGIKEAYEEVLTRIKNRY